MHSFARSIATWSLVAAATAVLAACAGDVKDIDRTGPNKIDKAVFEGEWYFRPMVLEAPYAQGIVFEGLEGDMDRIRWDIREQELIAYRSYELLEGAESGTGDPEFHGNPVAAFKILKHFDVIRDYNTSTGAQGNVIVENDTDRPWYERQYMRVDWSQNLLTDTWTLLGTIQVYSAAPYYVQEQEIDNPDRAEVTATNINIVNNYILETDIWTCYDLFFDPTWCGATNVKMKLSFMKVGDRSYEQWYYPDRAHILNVDTQKPFWSDWKGVMCVGDDPQNDMEPDYANCTKVGIPMFERFGYFRTERRAYDNEYQWTRDGRIFLINRWNMWKRAFDGQGNRIPAEFRELNKITYYSNVDYPDDAGIWRATQNMANDWDRSFRNTAVEIKRKLNPSITASDLPTVFEVRKNSCNLVDVTAYAAEHELTDDLAEFGISTITKGNLKRACAVLEARSNGDFQWQKQGDIRHSFVTWVDTPQAAGPLGYGPSDPDPVTGEIISGTANLYGASIDSYAAYAADVVALMNGDITLDEVMTGEMVREQVAQNRTRIWGDFSASDLAPMNRRFAQRADAMGEQWIPNAEDARAANRAKLQRVMGTSLERELLVNEDIKKALLGPGRYQPGASNDELGQFSPLQAMLDDGQRRYKQRMIDLGARAVDMAEFSDEGIGSLAEELQGKSWEEVYDLVREWMYRSLVTHEMGHTLGLRHNFEASFDPLNYKPEFWSYYNANEERTDGGTGMVVKTNADGSHTRAERLMYSSIMDYDARFYADTLDGTAPYDNAAIMFGYGGLVEVFTAPIAFGYESLISLYDYNDIPKVFDESLRCGDTKADCPVIYNNPTVFPTPEKYNADENYNTYFFTALKNAQPRVDSIWQRGYVDFNWLYDQYTNYYNYWYNGHSEMEYELPDEVPYLFCPDEYSWESNIPCQPYDKGGNYTEVLADRWERYNKYYFFTNFKRDRAGFNDYSYINYYVSRLRSRYLDPMVNIYRYYLIGAGSLGRDNAGNVLRINDLPIGADWQRATINGLNYVASILATPEPGDYWLDESNPADPVYRHYDGDHASFLAAHPNAADRLSVPLGIGKYYNTTWTDEFYYKATRIGAFWDKVGALFSITSNEGSFYRNFSDYLDAGAMNLSYWRGLEWEMLDLFQAPFLGTPGNYAWRYDNSKVDESDRFMPTPVIDPYLQCLEAEVESASGRPLDCEALRPKKFPYALPKIEPATSWTLRYYGIVLPMARFNSFYDYTPDFNNFARICLDGSTECMNISGAGEERYTDPLTGYTYIAPITNVAVVEDPIDGTIHDDRAIGARLVISARQDAQGYAGIKAKWDDAEQFSRGEIADIVIDTTEGELIGKPAGTYNDATLSESEQQTIIMHRYDVLLEKEAKINENSSFLNIVRELSNAFEFGG